MRRSRALTLICVICMLFMSSIALAETQVGDQTFTNKGIGINIDANGNIDSRGVIADHGTYVTVTDIHIIPLPPGTTKASISYKEEDIRNMGGEGINLNTNGHAFKDGEDALRKSGNQRPDGGTVIKSQHVTTDEYGNAVLRVETVSTVSIDKVRNTHFATWAGKQAATRLAESNMDTSAKAAIIEAELRGSMESTSNIDYKTLAMNLAKNPDYYAVNDFMMISIFFYF